MQKSSWLANGQMHVPWARQPGAFWQRMTRAGKKAGYDRYIGAREKQPDARAERANWTPE